MTTRTIHVVPSPGTNLSAFGLHLLPGRLYRITPPMAESQRGDDGESWTDDLSDLGQRRRWDRKLLQVAEVERARPGATLARLRAIAGAAFEGLGMMRTGDELVMTVEMVRQLGWLQPHVQLAAHGQQVFTVETLGADG